MRPIFSFIFELITDPLALPISPLWEYLILLVLGEIAFRIAWEASPGGFGGSAIHWFVCAIAFVAMWAAAYLEGVCAFVTHDGICRKPSDAWKRQFNKLQEARKND